MGVFWSTVPKAIPVKDSGYVSKRGWTPARKEAIISLSSTARCYCQNFNRATKSIFQGRIKKSRTPRPVGTSPSQWESAREAEQSARGWTHSPRAVLRAARPGSAHSSTDFSSD
ncbi:hypothetical protein EYF80_014440 [Liparis tanakae]|uniref:Uncharacterized protein n=1 Tax=Liparis tanakae TaxID=230148 RepID=A0A4Z2IEE1_9TELE|nr:hypothetical protein EYF80_014440 [Liparis tanakae]